MMVTMPKRNDSLRDELVSVALAWQGRYGVAPRITDAISEYDAAILVGFPDGEYSSFMQDKTAVERGSDFSYKGVRYQVKANRPSGKPGSRVTLVAKVRNYEWDRLIWILYDKNYVMQEAWQWEAEAYKRAFHDTGRLSPDHYRKGLQLFQADTA